MTPGYIRKAQPRTPRRAVCQSGDVPDRSVSWYFLSFANTHRNLGGAVVEGRDYHAAIRRAHDLGIYPKARNCEVLGTPLYDDDIKQIPETIRNRHLTANEIIGQLHGWWF